MQAVDTLLYPRWIIPIEPHNALMEEHAIAIQHSRIVALLPAKQAQQTYLAKNTIHLTEHVVLPGLVNAHTHSAMSLFRGLADDLTLMDWLENHIWLAEKQYLNKDFIYDGTRLAILEMLRSGTTCFNDHYYFPNEIAKAAVAIGMRAAVGSFIIGFSSPYAFSTDEYLAKVSEHYHAWQNNALITPIIAPHAPYTVDDATFLAVKELAEKYPQRIHLHLHETQDEIKESLKQYGKSPIKRLAELGLMSEQLIAVHMVHVDQEDLTILQQTQPHIVHCPESNLKLASGFAPIAKLTKQNNVALGTDGAASNNDLDMFGEMRTAAFLAKPLAADSTVLVAPDILRMATLNAAKALGLAHEIGSIEPGKAADLIAVNLADLNTQPVYHPISQLIYAVNSRQVSDVWIAGKQLLKAGEFVDIDVKEVVAKAQHWAEKFKLSKLD